MLLPLPQISCILGTNSKHSVDVVDVIINAVVVINANVTRSAIKLAKTTTMELVITTLYTDSPMYCESLS